MFCGVAHHYDPHHWISQSLPTHLGQHCPGGVWVSWEGQERTGHTSLVQRVRPPWNKNKITAELTFEWNFPRKVICLILLSIFQCFMHHQKRGCVVECVTSYYLCKLLTSDLWNMLRYLVQSLHQCKVWIFWFSFISTRAELVHS